MARNTRFCHFLQKHHGPTDRRTDGRTDRRTDGRTDTASYRDARTHLKTYSVQFVLNNLVPKEKSVYSTALDVLFAALTRVEIDRF